MKHRGIVVAAASAATVPLVLLAVGALRGGRALGSLEPGLLLSNWVYMVAPSAVAVVIALLIRPARPRFLPGALVALTLLLVVFQVWVWGWVPVRESGMVWVLYFPLCALVLVVVGLVTALAAWWRRRAR